MRIVPLREWSPIAHQSVSSFPRKVYWELFAGVREVRGKPL
jgi:hypothetical protein